MGGLGSATSQLGAGDWCFSSFFIKDISFFVFMVCGEKKNMQNMPKKTIPQSKIRDFCQPPLHKGALGSQ